VDGVRRLNQVAAWLLIGLGGALLLLSAPGFVGAVWDREWTQAAWIAGFMALFGFGVYRGVQQLRLMRAEHRPPP
jgi:hypothetical protein